MRKLWEDMIAILKAPLDGQLDTVHLFLITGLVLVAIVFWLLIYKELIRGAQEIVT